MRIKVNYKKVQGKVEFPDADRIDRTRFAAALGVSVSMATKMIRDGYVPAKYVEAIKGMPLASVATLRKPIRKGDSNG